MTTSISRVQSSKSIVVTISGVVEFLSAGRVSAEHRDFKELGYAGSLRRMPGSEHEFTHNFKLASAYSEDIMPYTNYTWVIGLCNGVITL